MKVMKRSITLVWSFRNRLDVFKKSILTAHKFCPLDVNFCLIDAASEEATIRKLRVFCNSIKGRKIRICESVYRSSLSEAWNLGIMLSDTRYVIFSSSDVEFKDNKWFKDIEKMIAAGYEYVLVENHAVFMIDKKIIPKIGWFDERYEIGPHFDTDYMIKSSEGKLKFIILQNKGTYVHGDTLHITNARKKAEIKDRLPMHQNTNDIILKKKWKTSWSGWQDRIHPPTHISQVKRTSTEIDPHPYFTKKYKKLYRDGLTKKISDTIKRIPIKISQRLSK